MRMRTVSYSLGMRSSHIHKRAWFMFYFQDAAAGTISFAVKNYDWDGTQSPTSFGPSARFDQAADVIVYGTCFLGDLKLKINQSQDIK